MNEESKNRGIEDLIKRPLKKTEISRNSLPRTSGTQKLVPGEPGQAPTKVGDAMIRYVFFI